MSESVDDRHKRWQLAELLRQYPALRITPLGSEDLVLAGRLPFHVTGPEGRAIADEYMVEILVPPDFPRSLALARETGERIPLKHHKLVEDFLCLGTPTEQRLVLSSSPTLPCFVSQLVVPYLYGYSYSVLYGVMPFGEEDHGDQGIRDHLGRLYHAPAIVGVEDFLRLTSLKKRSANKLLCPCQSGLRLGRCHNRVVNRLRLRLGTRWFRDEHVAVCSLLGKRSNSKRPREVKPPTLREALNRAANPADSSHSTLEWISATASATARTIDATFSGGARNANSA